MDILFIGDFENILANVLINFNICQLFMHFLPGWVNILHAIWDIDPPIYYLCHVFFLKEIISLLFWVIEYSLSCNFYFFSSDNSQSISE